MKIQLTEQKKNSLRMTFAILAAAFLTYTAICGYAGISGNIEFFQNEVVHFSRHWWLRHYPYWFIHGTLSGMLAVLCLYVLYRLKSSKKRYGTLILCLLIPYFVNVLFDPGSENFRVIAIAMGLFIGLMFAMANLPGMIGRAIIDRFVLQMPAPEETPEMFCKRKLHQIEWIRFIPLKKVLIGGLWSAAVVFGFLGIAAFCDDPQLDFLMTSCLFLFVAVFTARKAWRYIKTPYHCVPILNKELSCEQIESLMQNEQLERISFEDEVLHKHMPILVSENWALVEGLLVSRKLVFRGDVVRGGRERRGSRIRFTYLNGEEFRTRTTDIYLDGEDARSIQDELYRIAGGDFPIRSPQKIKQKYASILPELQDPKEKLWHLLSCDTSPIKAEYEAEFCPNKQPHKMKRSKKAASRK